MSKKATIVLGATGLEITAEPVATNSTEVITKHEIVGVFPIKRNVKPTDPEEAKWWIYPYPTMTIIDITLSNGTHYNVELQDVTNQPTWNLGTLASLNQAVTDINAWL